MFYVGLMICVIIWLYFLSLLKRAQLNAYYFLFGVMGVLLIILLYRKELVLLTAHFLCILMARISHIIPLYRVYIQQEMIKVAGIKLPIGYEFSALLEMLFFESLIVFFPVYRVYEKVVLSVIGLGYIFLINLLRIGLMIISIYYLKAYIPLMVIFSFYRLFLYVAILILFYGMFTCPQIVRGNIDYHRHQKQKYQRAKKRSENS